MRVAPGPQEQDGGDPTEPASIPRDGSEPPQADMSVAETTRMGCQGSCRKQMSTYLFRNLRLQPPTSLEDSPGRPHWQILSNV